jgi:murein DD-endopeptidase MepM/ murein hydrolase activator NlpD
MPALPTLGGAPPSRGPLVPVALAATLIGLLAGGGYWLTHRSAAEEPPVAAVPDVSTVDAGAALTQAPPAPTAADLAAKNGLKVLSATINGPLESAVIAASSKDIGTPLTQVITRSLVWWLRVPHDLVKGDTLAVIFEPRDGQEPLVHAVRFTSKKLGKTFEAYRYQPKDTQFARYYQPDGSELEERLVDSPLDNYEQITSLLRDGRNHKGVDFKTPVGSNVKATFDGTITRKNWNFRGNGNSIEVAEAGGQGRTVMFLHLSELPKTLGAGQRVKKGEIIAKSGNTGHSFAPHLHYQLMQGDKVIDPFVSQKITRQSLPSADLAAFQAELARFRALLPADQVVGG